MNNQRDRLGTDPGIGPELGDPEAPAARPAVYLEPTPVPAPAELRAPALPSVQLADEIDPRKQPTELRLRPVISSSLTPPPDELGEEPVFELRGQRSDSGWPPPETVVTTSQRPLPLEPKRRFRGPLALVAVLAALLLLVLGRALMSHEPAVAEPRAAAAPVAAPPVVAATPPRSAALSVAKTAAASVAISAPPAPAPAPSPALAAVHHAPLPSKPAVEPAGSARAQSEAEPAASETKPKRAIY